MLGWVIQQVAGFANLVGKLYHAVQKLCANTTTFGTVIHFDLQPCHGHLLGLVQGCSPSFKRIDDKITGLGRTPKGDVQLRAVFIHNPARNVLLVQAEVVVTRLVIAPRQATSGDIPNAIVSGQFLPRRC